MSRRVRTAPLLLVLLAAFTVVSGQRDLILDSQALQRLNQRVIESFKDDNEVVCTFCLFQVVASAYQLGNADVRREIRDALGPQDLAALSEALLQQARLLTTLNGTLTGYYQHGVFDQCPTRTKPQQCASIDHILKTRGYSVDFSDSRTKDNINAAVEGATDGKIKNLFTSLAANTKLVFASTLVYQDKWVSRLSSAERNFSLAPDTNPVLVPTLFSDEVMPVLDGPDGVQGVSMAYEDPGIRLYCFVARDKYADIRHLLYHEHYKNLSLATAQQRFAAVRLPKFDIVSKEHSYTEFMQQMGMRQMFQGGLGPEDKLKVDQLVHKAVIQTDEDGTSAAGAAGIAFVPLSAVLDEFFLPFNKPFICSLVHEELGQPLFTAYIADPRRQ